MTPRNAQEVRARGFTLLELLTVVAIISILAVIALPIYQNYSTRTQVAEGLKLVGSLEPMVTSYYLENGKWPASNDSAGVSAPTSYAGNYVQQIAVEPPDDANGKIGKIVITYKIPALGSKNTIIVKPNATSGGSFTWGCTGGTIPPQYRPDVCRP